MAKLVAPSQATHVFVAVGLKDGKPTEHFLYYTIEGSDEYMTVKDAVREIEEAGWYIKSSQVRPVRKSDNHIPNIKGLNFLK